MKLVAFAAGRRNGNTEIYVKEALMAAEEKGIEVELYRLTEYNLHNCSACSTAAFCAADTDIEKCLYKDDAPFLAEAFLESDGVIIAAPAYSLSANSLFFAFRDRVFGPRMDIASPSLGMPSPAFIKGRYKYRPAGLISVGGCLHEHWTGFSLANLFTAVIPPQSEVVDHLNVYGIAEMNAAAVNEHWLKKARKLGDNVADAMLTGDNRWRGGDRGTCPVCHLNYIEITPGTDDVMCPLCGIYGKISVKDGVTTLDWPDTPECRGENRFTVEGKIYHLNDIKKCMEEFAPIREEAKQKAQKYRNYMSCIIKPPTKAKR
ncbi:MAG: flavodoxin family protein [Clostridiales bacterium]|nr:flavodoxin family protein [Clostridiales bacterium]